MDTEFELRSLDNGLRIINEKVSGYKSFAVSISINAGSKDDYPDRSGLAHFLEHLVFRHTVSKSSKQISNEFEKIGAYLNAFTTKEFICFYTRAVNEHLFKVIELLAEIVFLPLFRLKDIDKERKVICEEVLSYNDDPEELIHDCADELIFRKHPFEFPVSGKIITIDEISKDDIIKFHSDNFVPQNCLLAFAGDIRTDELEKIVTNVFSHPKFTELNKKTLNLPKEITEQSIQFSALMKRKALKREFVKDFSQSHFLYGILVPGIKSTERYLIAAFNIILGDGMSSRLNQSLREKKAYVYSVYSNYNTYTNIGTVTIYASSEKLKTERIKNLIIKELNNIYQNGITSRELQRAKEQLKSGTIMALESLTDRMQSTVKSIFSLGKYETLADTLTEIECLTVEDVNKMILKYFNPVRWSEIIFK